MSQLSWMITITDRKKRRILWRCTSNRTYM